MTLEAFRTEVLRHLPALASWEFSDRWDRDGDRALNARHAASNTVVWLAEGRGGEWWHIDAPWFPSFSAQTLPETIERWRNRHADRLQALYDLTVGP